VKTALNVRQGNYHQKWLLKYTSAHNHLPTNTGTPSEESTIIKYGMQITEWKDYGVTFNTCTQTAGTIFLHYQRWVREHESGLKNWQCSTNFLTKLLPFLAQILV
jgi:hypothetical protein